MTPPNKTQAARKTTALIANDPDWITTIIPVRNGLQVAYKR